MHTSEFLIFAGSGLLFLLLSLPMANIAWSVSLPPSSPTTTISFSEIDDDMRVSYIEVERYEYICLGSMAKVGTQVLYDPDYPNRCREPEYLWKLGSWERIGLVGWLFGIGGMFYALIAGLFLTGRPTDQKKG